MHQFLLDNSGIIQSKDYTIDILNRGFQFGDGVFETIAVYDSVPMFFKDHLSRLYKAMESIDLIAPMSYRQLEDQLLELLSKNRVRFGKLKVHAIRNSEGQFKPTHDEGVFLATSEDHDTLYEGNSIRVCMYRESFKSYGSTSMFKTHSSLLNVISSIYARDHGFHDAVLINPESNIVECTSSNLFLVKDEIIYTPDIRSGCVSGIMRRNLIHFLQMEGYTIKELAISEQELLDADEVFITNSIRGIIPVDLIENTSLRSDFTKQIRSSFYYLNGIRA